MKPGDFAVQKIEGITGRLIRFGQWLNGDGFADYEHAFVIVSEFSIVEAMPGGARISKLPDMRRCPAYTAVSQFDGLRIAEEAVKLSGTPYSFVDYLALAAVRLHLPLSSKLLAGYVANSKHMICSQLVDEAYLRAGIHLFDDGRLPGNVTPGDLYRLIREQ